MINSNCVLFYLFQFTVICAASIVIIILVSPLFSTLLSSINCHCNQFLQHQPFVVIHLRPELPEYYFGSYSQQTLMCNCVKCLCKVQHKHINLSTFDISRVRSCQVRSSCVSHDLLFLNPCWESARIL